MTSRTVRRAGAALLPAAFVALLSGGCSTSSRPATVTGTVTYKGVALKSGEIAFVGEGGSRSAVIGTDGTYQIDDTAVGAVSVGVVATTMVTLSAPPPPPSPDGQTVAGPPPQMIERSLIPKKYNDPKGSGLKYTLIAGRQTINIELKD